LTHKFGFEANDAKFGLDPEQKKVMENKPELGFNQSRISMIFLENMKGKNIFLS